MIALYRGVSGVSRAIRWWHRGIYSHAAEVNELTGEVIEAWHVGGVRKLGSLHEGHTVGTVVDLFWSPLDAEEQGLLWAALSREVGKGYDWGGIARFATRARGDDPARWFCSELVAEMRWRIGAPLFRGARSWEIWPTALSWSTEVSLVGSMMVGSMEPTWMAAPVEAQAAVWRAVGKG